MVRINKICLRTVWFLLTWGLISCQAFMTPTADNNGLETISPKELQDLPPEFVVIQDQQIRQWAVEGVASTEYANPEWAALQVVGAPDTQRCGDYQTAWAAAGSDSIAWVDVKFTVAVHVTAINIIQSFNPNQVVKVELIDAFDRLYEVYNQLPVQVDQLCPYTLSVPIEKTAGRFDTVRITIDQSILGLGWNQIDAVELVGEPE